MEKRPLFILGDLLANCCVATLATALSAWLIGGSLGMLPGMLAGMLLGMLISLPLGVGLLSMLLGIMEVMMPCMLSGMLGGMWGGMWPLQTEDIFQWGIGTGVSMVIVIYTLNAFMSGLQKLAN
jgi:hypothetical protein